jgi:DNA mismatch repair ATPase MutL
VNFEVPTHPTVTSTYRTTIFHLHELAGLLLAALRSFERAFLYYPTLKQALKMFSNDFNMGRIRKLPSGVANHVRASQVIGSIERGVEELLQNSIIHGAAKSVAVTMGTKPNDDYVIVVEDDGVGIDNDSMRMLIGTEACSNDACNVFGNQGRGDSLRSIAALCVMVKIESTYKFKNGSVSSTKIIKNGVSVSFEDSTSHGPSSSSIIPNVRSIAKNKSTGTRITLRNMFQQFAVRRKHHHSKDLLATVRTMMSMLALVYPLVSFKLVNGETGKVDSMLEAPRFASNFSGPLTCRVSQHHGLPASLKDEANALVEKMDKMDSDEDSMGRRRSIQLAGEDGNVFRAFGVIFLLDDETVCRGRKIQLQVAVNGRPAAQTKQIVEVIQDQVKKHFGDNSCE